MAETTGGAASPRQAYRRVVWRWGQYLGAALSAFAIIQVGIIGELQAGAWLGIAQWVVIFVLGYRAMLQYQRDAGNVALGYGKALGLGMLTSLVGCALYGVVYWVLMVYVRPQYYQGIVEVMEKSFLQTIGTLGEEQGELSYKLFKEMLSPGLVAFSMALGMVVNSLFCMLVSAFWAQQRRRMRGMAPPKEEE